MHIEGNLTLQMTSNRVVFTPTGFGTLITMIKLHFVRRLIVINLVLTIVVWISFSTAQAQMKDTPLTSQELVKLLYELPKQPEKKEELIEAIRRRGIGFPLTDGMLGIAASKSGNDSTLRKTLQEAERRRINPITAALPSEADALELLARTRTATHAATEAMPDFVVKQLVTRSYALGKTNSWISLDRLTIAVSFRAAAGEEYKVLTINGAPPNKESSEASNYSQQVGGSTSAGEFASTLALTFEEDRKTTFKLVDTDMLRGRSALIFQYQVELGSSALRVSIGDLKGIVAYHGRVWIDRELNRVLRFEIIIDPPETFRTTAASQLIDYDWVTIADQKYLLPVEADVRISSPERAEVFTTRNLIRFRGYQKYGTDVKIIEEDIIEDLPEPKR